MFGNNFKSYGYVSGLTNDTGISKLMLEVNNDGLYIYHKRLQNVITVAYADIVSIELHSDIDIKQSTPKSLFSAAVLGSVGGIGAGLFGAIFGGIKTKDIYLLEIQIRENNEIYSLLLTDNKSKLLTLAQSIENQANKG